MRAESCLLELCRTGASSRANALNVAKWQSGVVAKPNFPQTPNSTFNLPNQYVWEAGMYCSRIIADSYLYFKKLAAFFVYFRNFLYFCNCSHTEALPVGGSDEEWGPIYRKSVICALCLTTRNLAVPNN